MRTGKSAGMPGAPGATAHEPAGEEPPTRYDAASMEGNPHLPSNKTQCDSIFEMWSDFMAEI